MTHCESLVECVIVAKFEPIRHNGTELHPLTFLCHVTFSDRIGYFQAIRMAFVHVPPRLIDKKTGTLRCLFVILVKSKLNCLE